MPEQADAGHGSGMGPQRPLSSAPAPALQPPATATAQPGHLRKRAFTAAHSLARGMRSSKSAPTVKNTDNKVANHRKKAGGKNPGGELEAPAVRAAQDFLATAILRPTRQRRDNPVALPTYTIQHANHAPPVERSDDVREIRKKGKAASELEAPPPPLSLPTLSSPSLAPTEPICIADIIETPQEELDLEGATPEEYEMKLRLSLRTLAARANGLTSSFQLEPPSRESAAAGDIMGAEQVLGEDISSLLAQKLLGVVEPLLKLQQGRDISHLEEEGPLRREENAAIASAQAAVLLEGMEMDTAEQPHVHRYQFDCEEEPSPGLFVDNDGPAGGLAKVVHPEDKLQLFLDTNNDGNEHHDERYVAGAFHNANRNYTGSYINAAAADGSYMPSLSSPILDSPGASPWIHALPSDHMHMHERARDRYHTYDRAAALAPSLEGESPNLNEWAQHQYQCLGHHGGGSTLNPQHAQHAQQGYQCIGIPSRSELVPIDLQNDLPRSRSSNLQWEDDVMYTSTNDGNTKNFLFRQKKDGRSDTDRQYQYRTSADDTTEQQYENMGGRGIPEASLTLRGRQPPAAGQQYDSKFGVEPETAPDPSHQHVQWLGQPSAAYAEPNTPHDRIPTTSSAFLRQDMPSDGITMLKNGLDSLGDLQSLSLSICGSGGGGGGSASPPCGGRGDITIDGTASPMCSSPASGTKSSASLPSDFDLDL